MFLFFFLSGFFSILLVCHIDMNGGCVDQCKWAGMKTKEGQKCKEGLPKGSVQEKAKASWELNYKLNRQ